MAVEFVIHTSDLRLATSQVKINRGEYRNSDAVDILVSECLATFRAIGTETEVPVTGKQIGSVRLSLKSLRDLLRVALSFKKREVRFLFEPGEANVETFSRSHPDIELGTIPDQQLLIPVDVSVLDTLALAEILGPERVIREGMRARVEDAIKARALAVSGALPLLESLGITERQLQALAESNIKAASDRLRKSIAA